MKKNLFYFLMIALFALQSCSLNSEITYHKDAASTAVMDLDMKEAMDMLNAMSSESDKNPDFAEMEKLPKKWTSLYDIEKKDGKLKTTNPDSIRLMKKIFMKSNSDGKDFTGFSIKMDHFTKEDHKAVKNLSSERVLSNQLNEMTFSDWNGKTLTIDTKILNLGSFKEIMSGKDMVGKKDASAEEDAAHITSMMSTMFKSIGTKLKFENKIKSITGKHDWISKIDDHTIEIKYDLQAMFGNDKKPLKNADKTITIVTE